MNWTQITVSMVQNVTDTNPKPVQLAQWLHAMKVSNISGTDKKKRPALLPHGQFHGGRQSRHLIQESGLMQFDIDLRDNPGLCHDEVKRRAAQVPTIVLCAASAAGGMWGLAIREPDQDLQLDEIEQSLSVILDRCNSRSVAALRFASFDPNPHTKHTA